MKIKSRNILLCRVSIGLIGICLWFSALQNAEFGQVTALTQSSALFVALFAPIFLSDPAIISPRLDQNALANVWTLHLDTQIGPGKIELLLLARRAMRKAALQWYCITAPHFKKHIKKNCAQADICLSKSTTRLE